MSRDCPKRDRLVAYGKMTRSFPVDFEGPSSSSTCIWLVLPVTSTVLLLLVLVLQLIVLLLLYNILIVAFLVVIMLV